VRHILLGALLFPCICAAAPLDDSGWARYFSDATFLYAASRSPRDLPGPLAAAWAKRLDGELAESAAPDNLLARAVREKVIEKPLDVLAGGGRWGSAGRSSGPASCWCSHAIRHWTTCSPGRRRRTRPAP